MLLYKLVYAALSSSLAWPSLGRRFVEPVFLEQRFSGSNDGAATAVPVHASQYDRTVAVLVSRAHLS
jgi:hypothetical protein